ncbi:MAG: hypothetical protein QOD92_434 [Acidimicrobiaceae bacterium]|jgi:hypothetical protein
MVSTLTPEMDDLVRETSLMEEDSTEGRESGEGFFHSESFELLMIVNGVEAAIDALDEFVDPRRRQQFLRAIVDKLEHAVPDDGGPTNTGEVLDDAMQHTLNGRWARATSELGELARMAFDYPESVTMFRKSLRVSSGFGEQSRLDLVVVLGYVAALANDPDICLDALTLCDLLPGTPTHPTLLAVTQQLCELNGWISSPSGDVEQLLARLRA